VITYNIFTTNDGSYIECDRLRYYGWAVNFRMDGYWYAIPHSRVIEIMQINHGNWLSNMIKSLKEKMRNANY
jgi:hypothetical protein